MNQGDVTPKRTAAELDKDGVPVAIYHEGGSGRNLQMWTHDLMATCAFCPTVAKRKAWAARVKGTK